MQMNQKELQQIMNAEFDENFDMDIYEGVQSGFQKITKTQKSFDDGVSKKKNFNPKKSKSFQHSKSY